MSTPPIPPTPPQPGFEQVILPPVSQAPTGYPPAPSQVYAQPGYPPPTAPKSGNMVLKIVLAVVAVIVLFGVLAAAAIGYIGYRASKAIHRAANGDVSFSTPNGGTISAGGNTAISSADLGVPEYPGAKRSVGGMRMKTSAGSLITAVFSTTDSADKVAAFYKDKMGDQASTMESNGGTVITSGESRDDKTIVTITPDESSNSTKIAIVHTSHPHGQ